MGVVVGEPPFVSIWGVAGWGFCDPHGVYIGVWFHTQKGSGVRERVFQCDFEMTIDT